MAEWHDLKLRNGLNELGPLIDFAFGDERLPITWNFGDEPPEASTAHYPVILKLKAPWSAAQFARGDFFDSTQLPDGWIAGTWRKIVRVPPVSLGAGRGQPYFTALAMKKLFAYFDEGYAPQGEQPVPHVAVALQKAIQRLAISRPVPEDALADAVLPEEDPAEAGPAPISSGAPERGTVAVGIIDDGLAFANARFRTAAGRTRVEHLWLQDGAADGTATRYGYGRVRTKPELDALLTAATCPLARTIDEDEVYRRVGAVDLSDHPKPSGRQALNPLLLRASHGVHVMDIACGYAPGTAPRLPGTRGEDNRPIICVQLPSAVSEDTSGASLHTFVVDGVRYILEKADDIARERDCGPLPVVINLSYGMLAGRHDGTSDLERALGELIRQQNGRLQIVIAAGNARLDRCHAMLKFEGRNGAEGSEKTLSWRVLPDDRTLTHLEIWLPRGAPADRLSLTVTPPGGVPMEPPLGEDLGRPLVWGRTPQAAECFVRYSYAPAPADRAAFFVTLLPTVPRTESAPAAQPGVWTITLRNAKLEPEQQVHAWIQRDNARFGRLPFGRQSHFEDENYVRSGEDGRVPEHDAEASQVKRAGTLNAITAAPEIILVGGFHRKERRPADFSGEGWTGWLKEHPAKADPAAATYKTQPDLSTPSDDSLVHRGILAAGTHSGSVVALSGTSVAAPQVTRIVAHQLAEGKPAGPEAIRALAARVDSEAHSVDSEAHSCTYPHARLGAGRIDPYLLPPEEGGVTAAVCRYAPVDDHDRAFSAGTGESTDEIPALSGGNLGVAGE